MQGIENVPAVPDKLPLEGTCADRFAPVREAFACNLGTGQDVGASVAVLLDGEPVVDLWGGYVDGTYTRPFGPDTIVQGYSTTKTVTALCALVLADRGRSTWTRRSPGTGPSSRRRARPTSWCGSRSGTRRGCAGGTWR